MWGERVDQGRAPPRMEQSFHPPLAAAERAALRSARSSARADGSSGSAGCGAELFLRERRERGRAPALPLPPTTDNRPLPHADGDKSAGRGGPALPGILNSGGRDDHPP